MFVLVVQIYTLPFQTLYFILVLLFLHWERTSVCFSKCFIQKEENVANVACVNTID